MRLSFIPLLLIAIPLTEITAFVVIGSRIGVVWTLGFVLLSSVIGALLVRWQGFSLIARIRAETAAGRVPSRELAHGAMILMAGVLLIVPGFVTDAIGFLLFMPPVREAAWRAFRSRITVASMEPRPGPRPGPGVGDLKRTDDRVVDLDPEDFTRKPDTGSPWGKEKS